MCHYRGLTCCWLTIVNCFIPGQKAKNVLNLSVVPALSNYGIIIVAEQTNDGVQRNPSWILG